MAGDWIKIESVTPEKPEVFMIAEDLNIEPEHAFGCLSIIWIWADQQTINGNAPSVSKLLLDRKASVKGFADAMIKAGWLIEKDGNLSFSNFDRHNGKTAKNRALTAKRVASFKEKTGNAKVTPAALPREEKRREENKENNKKKNPAFKKPSVEEIKKHLDEKNITSFSAEQFFNHYESANWYRGKTKIKNWKACVSTWTKNSNSNNDKINYREIA